MLACNDWVTFYFYATIFHSFVVVIITAIYTPSNANTKTALGYLIAVITKQQSIHPEGVFVPAGDLTKVNLKTVLPKLYQHLQFPRRGKTNLTMFTVTSNMEINLHLSQSDHISYLQPGHQLLTSRGASEMPEQLTSKGLQATLQTQAHGKAPVISLIKIQTPT